MSVARSWPDRWRPRGAPCRRSRRWPADAHWARTPAALTRSVWPSRLAVSPPLAASHNRTVPSPPALASRCRSGEIANPGHLAGVALQDASERGGALGKSPQRRRVTARRQGGQGLGYRSARWAGAGGWPGSRRGRLASAGVRKVDLPPQQAQQPCDRRVIRGTARRLGVSVTRPRRVPLRKHRCARYARSHPSAIASSPCRARRLWGRWSPAAAAEASSPRGPGGENRVGSSSSDWGRGSRTGSAHDAGVPERVAAGLWPHTQPVWPLPDRDPREQPPRPGVDRVYRGVVAP